MNNADLQRLLKSSKVPARTDDYWEQLPHRVLAALRRAPNVERSKGRWFPRLAWGIAAATACLVIGFVIGHWRGQNDTASNGLLQNEKVIREMMAMFPNQIRAIVQDERGLSLVLSERDDVPASPPLYIQVIQDGRRLSFLTFSGQEVQIAGQKVMVLSDAEGSVMLVGDRFLWSSAGAARTPGEMHVEARTLML